MQGPESISDYIKSKSNTALLKSFAIKKIRTDKPEVREDLILNCFDLYAEDIADSELEKVMHWAPSNENIAQININIWTLLKQRILSFLDSRALDPEKKIRELFDSSMSRAQAHQEQEQMTLERESLPLSLKKNN